MPGKKAKTEILSNIFVILTFEIRSIRLKVNLYCPTVFKFQQLDKKLTNWSNSPILKIIIKNIEQSLQHTPIN